MVGIPLASSKDRPSWKSLPHRVRNQVEGLLGGEVVTAQNCPGGFSPGFASQLHLASGGSAFVKAMDALSWPAEASMYREEAWVARTLPDTVPAPAFLGSADDGQWVILAFESISGHEPTQPWRLDELRRVAKAIAELSLHPSPALLTTDHPRLGGWAEIAQDADRAERLAAFSPWAAARLPELLALERVGLAAAKGPFLVHFDAYAHNVLLTDERVVLVDWPHARLGAPFVDLVLTLSSAAADQLDVEPVMREHEMDRQLSRESVTAVLAAHAGFCVSGGLARLPLAFNAIGTAKQHLGRGTLTWLQQRLAVSDDDNCSELRA